MTDNKVSKETPIVSILIVNWNGGQVLLDCLSSVPRGAQDLTYELILVDNASTDSSLEAVKEHFPWVKTIACQVNMGFAAANNIAVESAAGCYLLLLNPDTLLPESCLPPLVDYAESHSKIGCIGPGIIYPDGRPQRSCWKGYPGIGMALSDAFYLWKIPWLPISRRYEMPPAHLGSPFEVDHILGACMLIRREAWVQVGPFDDRFFLFFEETDWCYRAKISGWQIVYHPGVKITHLGEHSVYQDPENSIPHFYRSYCQYMRKHHSVPDSPRSIKIQINLLKLIFLHAYLIRLVLWKARQFLNRAAWPHAKSMQKGYLKAFRELGAC